MKRIIALIMVFVMFISIAPTSGVFALETDQKGTSFDSAVNMQFGRTYTYNWTIDNDHLYHYAKFTVTDKGIVTLKVNKPYDAEGEVSNYEIIVMDEDGDYVYGNTGRESKSNPRNYYQFSLGLAPGEYYVSFELGFTVQSGTIEMNYEVTFEENDYVEIESNETAEEATELTLGMMHKAYFGNEYSDYGNSDYWKFKTEEGKKYRLKFKNYSSIDETTTILESSLDIQEYKLRNNIDNDGYNYIEFTASSTATQYIWLHNYIKVQYEYGICVEEIKPPTVGTVNNLSASVTTDSVTLTWDAVPNATGYRIWLQDNETSEWKQLKLTSTNSFKHSGLQGSTKYYYAVQAYQDVANTRYLGEYAYITAYTLKAPTVGDIKNFRAQTTTNSIKLLWDAVPDATGYRIWLYNKELDKYELLEVTEKNTYTHTGLKKATTYSYAVHAFQDFQGKTYYGKYSYGYANTKLVSVKNLKATATNNSVELTWTKVAGATGYEIYRYNESKGSYTKVAATKKNSYIDTDRKAGTTYKYRVRAYKDTDAATFYSEYVKIETTTKLAVVSGFSGTATANSVKLTWKAVSRATGYEVYVYDTDSESWERITRTSKLQYTHKSLKAGTAYKYRIRAYKTLDDKKCYSKSYKTITVVTKPKAVSTFSAKAAKTSVTLTWGKVSGVDGYEIYRYDNAKSKYVKITATSKRTYTDKKLSAGTSYKYRIRTYKTIDGKKYYSSYKTLSVSTKSK